MKDQGHQQGLPKMQENVNADNQVLTGDQLRKSESFASSSLRGQALQQESPKLQEDVSEDGQILRVHLPKSGSLPSLSLKGPAPLQQGAQNLQENGDCDNQVSSEGQLPKSLSFASLSLKGQAIQQGPPNPQELVHPKRQGWSGGQPHSAKSQESKSLLPEPRSSSSNIQKQADSRGPNKVLQNPMSKQDLLSELLQWSVLTPLDPLLGLNQEDLHGDSKVEQETVQPELLKAIHAQTDVVEKPPRITAVGLIDPLEGTNPTSESQPLPNETSHLEEIELGSILDSYEEVDDLLSLLHLFSKSKLVPQKFHPSIGDVIIVAKSKRPSLKPEIAGASIISHAEAEPVEFYPSNEPTHLDGLVALYQDSFYFIDDGEYRKSESDVYEFQQGDIVVRLGHFNESWHWSHASKAHFYLYHPKREEGECCKDLGEVGPWFHLSNQKTSRTRGFEPDPPARIDPSVTPSDLLPFSTLSYPFKIRDGDILMHYTNDKTLLKPWNVGLSVTVENSRERGELEKIVQPTDKILRYGIHVQLDVSSGRESTTIYVELYQFQGGSEWIFLGKNEGLYNNGATLPAMIRFNVNTPHPGDIFINRRCYRPWDATKQTGGLVEIYTDESFFSLLEGPREKLQNHLWGIGSDTTIVRFGTFANKEWNWMPKPRVDIFILNSRGTSLRRHCRILWDDKWRPRANYNFNLYNAQNRSEVPAYFKPTTGDVIIRYLAGHLVWDGLGQIVEPSVKIEFFNALHLVGNALTDGDWLLRVGHERSDRYRLLTHVTAELYNYKVSPTNSRNKFWEFKGRDTYVFGALQWPARHGLFSGKEQERPYADPDDDLERGELPVQLAGVDQSRAVRLFLSGLGFQNMAYPLRCPWWYDIS